jgi:hypothetical protein
MRKVKALADKLGLALVDKASVGQQTTAAA